MSVHIVDRIEAIRFPKEAIDHYEDIYLVVELGGDNNVRNARTNRRARSWGATCIGPEWEVIGDCCRFAAGCSGGMTKLKGRVTKPESYIRAYRKAPAKADTIDGARMWGLHLTGRIRFDRNDRCAALHLQTAIKAGKTAHDESPYGEARSVITFDLTNPADLALWNNCRHSVGWNNVEVTGPGEV